MHSGKILWQSNFNNMDEVHKEWNIEVVGPRHNNNELQRYSEDSVSCKTGELIIQTSKNGRDIKSGRVNTRGKVQVQYGYIEASIKFPEGRGFWPAFWMLGNSQGWPNCGEIDIMEWVGWNPDAVYGTLHGPGYCGGNAYGSGGNHINGASLANNYHKYAVEWKPDSIKWFLDDKLFFEATPGGLHAKKGNQCRWVFNDRPGYIIVNMAVGGNFGGAFANSEQYIYQNLQSVSDMHVAYVRVYQTIDGYGNVQHS